MTNYVNLTKILNRACGIGAAHIGVPGWIYRITSSSNGDFIQDANKQFQIWADRAKMKRFDPAFESDIRMETYWFELLINANPLQVGDVWVINDPYLNVGDVTVPFETTQFIAFAMAAMPPLKHAISARLDTNAQFYRPSLQPISTPIGPNTLPYFDSTLPNELPLLCINGNFQLGTVVDTASKIPVGTMPMNNSGAIYTAPTANMPIQERRRIYIPSLPGWTFKAGDKIVTEQGSRYVILSNYSQDIGTIGNQFLIEKITSGPI
jgi:hypothetical protein